MPSAASVRLTSAKPSRPQGPRSGRSSLLTRRNGSRVPAPSWRPKIAQARIALLAQRLVSVSRPKPGRASDLGHPAGRGDVAERRRDERTIALFEDRHEVGGNGFVGREPLGRVPSRRFDRLSPLQFRRPRATAR
jgi:hypothetical protein